MAGLAQGGAGHLRQHAAIGGIASLHVERILQRAEIAEQVRFRRKPARGNVLPRLLDVMAESAPRLGIRTLQCDPHELEQRL